MRSLTALAFLSLFSNGLAEDAAVASSCAISQHLLPVITVHSCAGEGSSTKTVLPPGHTQLPGPEANPPSTTSGADPGTPEVGKPENGPGSQGHPEPDHPDSAPGASNTDISGPAQPSTTGPAIVPGSSATPETIPVADARMVSYDMMLLGIAGVIPLAMVWL